MFSSPIPGRVAPKGREPSLPGDKYNRLTLVSEVPGQIVKPSVRRWVCRCDCGTENNVRLSCVRLGQTESCGCLSREVRNKDYLVLPGHVFGKLTVVSRLPTKDSRTFWVVKCSCGVTKQVSQTSLKSGRTVSCSCFRNEANATRRITHNMTRTETYRSWASAKKRCTNPNSPDWPRYGGRGISFDPSWLDSFETFLNDMGECPPGCSIDRRDNSGGYSPANCRWATAKEQARNRASSFLISRLGRNISLAEAAELAGLNYKMVHARLTRYGWSISQALESHEFGEPLLELPN